MVSIIIISIIIRSAIIVVLLRGGRAGRFGEAGNR